MRHLAFSRPHHHTMEIQPTAARLEQVIRDDSGDLIRISPDVSEWAQKILDVHPSLRLRHSRAGGYFVVYQLIEQPDGTTDEQLVTTAVELDERLVNRCREVTAPDYDLVAEMARMDAQADRDQEHHLSERVGEHAEQLAHALAKDLDVKTQAFIPRDIADGEA